MKDIIFIIISVCSILSFPHVYDVISLLFLRCIDYIFSGNLLRKIRRFLLRDCRNDRKWIVFEQTLIILLIINSCNSKNENYIKLDFWAMGAEGEYVGKLIPKFEKLHPNIKINIQTIPWGAAHEKLLTAFAGQSMPDICQLGNTWIPEFQAIEAILKMDSLISTSSIISEKDFFEGILETNRIGKNLYGIPWYVDTRLLFYRDDILKNTGSENPPETWEEWIDISRKIKKLSTSERQKYGVFFSTIVNDWQVPVILIMQNNGKLLKDKNRYAAFDDSATVEALEFYISFFEEKLAIRNMSEVSNIYQAFSEGLFSMLVTGPWNVNEFKKRLKDENCHWNTAPMPAGKTRTSIAGGASLVISKKTKYPNGCWKFIEFLSQSDIQTEFYRLTKDLPSNKKSWENGKILTDQKIQAFYKQLDDVSATPKIPEWEQIAVKLQEHLEMVIHNKIELNEAILKLNKDVDKILEKRRWLIAKGLIQVNND